MGRKSSRKKLQRIAPTPTRQKERTQKNAFALFLIEVIRFAGYAALFVPLVVHSSFFFPFVVPKAVFFWIFSEIAFAAFLILAISNREFRPKWNAVSLSFLLFFAITIVSSFAGINIERSFWSTFERMAGTVNWIHLAIFFIALSSTWKTVSDWKKLLSASFIAAILVAAIFLLQKIGVSIIPFDTRSGATIGNSSFMAAYLLFNVFFGFWLAAKAKDPWQKSLYAAGLVFIVLAIMLSSANGAIVSMLGGGALIFLGWLFFARRVPCARLGATALLGLGVLAGSVMAWGVFTQNHAIVSKLPSFFSNTGPIGARKVVWDIALKGIKERPLLGWGPENYNVVFTKYFNPCLALSECGGEIWFDRTHNIILDHLINSGIIGLLSYFSLFGSALYMIGRKFVSSKEEWILPSVVIAALASYFVQNLLVFDMPSTYIMFSLTLALVGGMFAITPSIPAGESEKLRNPSPVAVTFVGVFLLYFLFSWGFQSLQAAHLGIVISRSDLAADKRLALYEKTLSVSPIGHSQIPDFFMDRVMSWIEGNSKISPEFIAGVEKIMIEHIAKNPEDFRSVLILSNFYSVAHAYNAEYLQKSAETARRAIAMSPANQQGYVALAQAYLSTKEYQSVIDNLKIALNLEPRYGRMHWLLSQVYAQAGEKDKEEESLKRAEELGYRAK
ncbi:MAG: O-antigen ligase family protein [Candidatus Spechtbacteria bacterium]|nr:O-antigen ligase family protein [Candidatus Spechtbacteria bacterium]